MTTIYMHYVVVPPSFFHKRRKRMTKPTGAQFLYALGTKGVTIFACFMIAVVYGASYER